MIYFDNATTSYPKAPDVASSVFDAINNIGSPNRSTHNLALSASKLLFKTRNNIATLFNVDNPLNIAFTSNATEGLNLVLSTLFNESDHIISSILEHNSVLRPLYKLNCHLSFIKCSTNGNLIFDDLHKLLKPNTKAIVITHASNVTGNIIDLDFISAFCKSNNILLILDASQSAGVIKVDSSLADFVIATGHKSLLGPQGTGIVICNKLPPTKVGGSGHHTFSKEHPNTMPDVLEAGTHNCHSLAGLNSSVEFILKTSVDKIYNHDFNLLTTFYNNIKNNPNIQIYGDFSTSFHMPLISLKIKHLTSTELSAILFDDYNIATRSGFHCSPLIHTFFNTEYTGLTRFSLSYFNTIEEVNYVTNILNSISVNN